MPPSPLPEGAEPSRAGPRGRAEAAGGRKSSAWFTAEPAPSRPRRDIRPLSGRGGGCGLPAPAPLLSSPLPAPLSPPSIAPTSPLRLPGQPGGLAGPAAGCGAGDAAAPPMVSRRRTPPHHVPAGPERMFEGCRRARSLWGGVRLEVAGESSPVVLHSFTQLDPDLPPLEVSAGDAGFGGAERGLGGSASLAAWAGLASCLWAPTECLAEFCYIESRGGLRWKGP